ncbi:hypothetical protein ACFSUI_19530 [Ralstonia solanacearum]
MRSDLDFINGSHLLTGALRLDAGLLCIINTDRGRGVNLLKAMAGYGTRFDPAGKEGHRGRPRVRWRHRAAIGIAICV